jgi:hypothetical protein
VEDASGLFANLYQTPKGTNPMKTDLPDENLEESIERVIKAFPIDSHGIRMTETKKDTRPRYPGVCPYCGEKFTACLSILQRDFGMLKNGVACCQKCNKGIQLIFDPVKKRFDVQTMEKFVEDFKQKDAFIPPVFEILNPKDTKKSE